MEDIALGDSPNAIPRVCKCLNTCQHNDCIVSTVSNVIDRNDDKMDNTSEVVQCVDHVASDVDTCENINDFDYLVLQQMSKNKLKRLNI